MTHREDMTPTDRYIWEPKRLFVDNYYLINQVFYFEENEYLPMAKRPNSNGEPSHLQFLFSGEELLFLNGIKKYISRLTIQFHRTL